MSGHSLFSFRDGERVFFNAKELGKDLLSQWLAFKLLGITYLVGKIKFELLFNGPKWLSKKMMYNIHSGKLTWQWKMDPLKSFEDVFPIEIGDIPLLY